MNRKERKIALHCLIDENKKAFEHTPKVLKRRINRFLDNDPDALEKFFIKCCFVVLEEKLTEELEEQFFLANEMMVYCFDNDKAFQKICDKNFLN